RLEGIEPHLVDEAPPPPFARLERANDRVLGGLEVLGGVLVLRIVAAPDVPALHAEPQVHPRVAHRQALLAALAVRVHLAIDAGQVGAAILFRHCPSPWRRSMTPIAGGDQCRGSQWGSG